MARLLRARQAKLKHLIWKRTCYVNSVVASFHMLACNSDAQRQYY